MRDRNIYWWKYPNAEMELRMRSCSPFAEGIAHRLFRAYFARERDIPTDNGALAFVCNVNVEDIESARRELESVVDLDGPTVRIEWLDEGIDHARAVREARRVAGTKGASSRWGDGKC